jgi:hypothetical protein
MATRAGVDKGAFVYLQRTLVKRQRFQWAVRDLEKAGERMSRDSGSAGDSARSIFLERESTPQDWLRLIEALGSAQTGREKVQFRDEIARVAGVLLRMEIARRCNAAASMYRRWSRRCARAAATPARVRCDWACTFSTM